MANQKALLIGINDYQSVNDLKGCINDVKNMRDVLMTYRGFTNYDTRVLFDSRATAENVKHRMDWLKDGMKAGDKILLHFSGHGSQVRDRDGDELKDYKDEIICLYNMSWEGGFISDDYFDEWFKTISEDVIVEILFDCCNSGTGESVDRSIKLDDRYMRNRYLEPPLDIIMRAEGEEIPSKKLGVASFIASFFSFSKPLTPEQPVAPSDSEEGSITVPSPSSHIIIWSGCGESQTSADAYINGAYNGAFSYFWCKHMRESNGNISRLDLLREIKNSLQKNSYNQIPELTCNEIYDTQNVLF